MSKKSKSTTNYVISCSDGDNDYESYHSFVDQIFTTEEDARLYAEDNELLEQYDLVEIIELGAVVASAKTQRVKVVWR